MTREERLALIDKLQAENDAMIIDNERRRQHRILHSDGSDLVSDDTALITKSLAPSPAEAQRVRDWAREQRQPQSSKYTDMRPTSVAYVEQSLDNLSDMIADEVGELMGEARREMENKLKELRDEVRAEVAKLVEVRNEMSAILEFLGKKPKARKRNAA